jgi:hypothetical protein
VYSVGVRIQGLDVGGWTLFCGRQKWATDWTIGGVSCKVYGVGCTVRGLGVGIQTLFCGRQKWATDWKSCSISFDDRTKSCLE